MTKRDLHQLQQASGTTAGMTEPHAVRWGLWEGAFKTHYSKWHWTLNASDTLCGRKIQLISDRWPYLPETDDEEETVTCKQCLRALKK